MTKLGIDIFTTSERSFLEEYKNILKPISVALDNLQRTKCAYGILLPTLFITQDELNSMKEEDSLVYCKPLLVAVINGFKKRFQSVMDFNNNESVPALIAAISHPHFKLRWLKPELRTGSNKDKLINIFVRAADHISVELKAKENGSTVVENNSKQKIEVTDVFETPGNGSSWFNSVNCFHY